MINWELLYNKLLETKSAETGEKHHIVPKHDGGKDEDGIVILERKHHILAHYIRFRWKGQVGDKVAVRMMLGQIKNPMHDENMLEKHRNVMSSAELRDIHSISMSKVWQNDNKRNNIIEGRQDWINSLEDKSILTKHLNTPEKRIIIELKHRDYYKSKSNRFIIMKGSFSMEFDLKVDLVKKMKIDPTTIDKYIDTDKEVRIGNLKGYKIFTKKIELV
jgi:hypothetical protein